MPLLSFTDDNILMFMYMTQYWKIDRFHAQSILQHTHALPLFVCRRMH